MTSCPRFQHLLTLPHLWVQNANAISSPLTHGFPAITAFLGLMWALQRKTHEAGLDLSFKAIGIVCHNHQEQVVEANFVKTFCLPRHPTDDKGKSAAIIEEGRIHFEISLIFAVTSQRWLQEPAAQDDEMVIVAELLAQMRIAGGSVIPPKHPEHPRYQPWVLALTGTNEDRQTAFSAARARLLPGFSLVSRPDIMEAQTAALQATHPTTTRFDAWLSLSRRQWRYQHLQGKEGRWQADSRKGQGWIVPIPVGYGALDRIQLAGSVANARSPAIPFCFVESLYSIGQWISPHRLYAPEQLLWYADSRPEEGAYLCRNDYQNRLDDMESLYDEDFY